ncbi:MAG TPA: 16S rRNA (cytidine(1402)-2'-O)-methyltransferase [Alphaproteobacteria bacterium]|nr:16S rRNA (cytidine(1402)-2'-O)-methyltransferase [Alphaproteobacteria bacterium]HJM48601.1 16S rRNA (cytidine(1402)-2'-O)-methyltransferase [Alphaproteobacteria bacterium]
MADPRKAPELAPGLYLVATPIGNAGDITLRALEVLAAVELIACEDSRLTGRLMRRYGIATQLLPYHDHNAARQRPRLLQRLAAGAAIALVSDAGTPLISDPGYKLVRDAVAAGAEVLAVPGASAVTAALSVAGLPTDRFHFAGFLPPKRPARRRALAGLAAIEATIVVLESARRLPAALADMAAELGPREAALARELTKLHEEVRRGPLDELAAHYAEAGPPRGEIVVVVAPPAPGADDIDEAELDGRLAALLDGGVRKAAAQVAAETGLPRRRLYARALELKQRRRP